MGRGLSQLQRAILEVLSEAGQPEPEPNDYGGFYIGHLLRPSEIITALGRDRTPSNYVAVSKALDRLCKRGLVDACRTPLPTQGRGFRYSIRLDDDETP